MLHGFQSLGFVKALIFTSVSFTTISLLYYYGKAHVIPDLYPVAIESSLSDAPLELKARLQLVAFWNGNQTMDFMALFFASVQKSSGSVRLLLVNLDQGSGCMFWHRYVGLNIQAICLTRKRYLDLVAGYLCSAWECSDDDLNAVVSRLIDRRYEQDDLFKPLIGQILSPYLFLHDYVAWIDLGGMLGNINALPDFALDGQFDMITIGSGGSDSYNVYMRPTFTAIKRSSYMDRVWLNIPELANVTSYLQTFPEISTTEGFWSVLYMEHLNINWLQLPNLQGEGVRTMLYTKCATQNGVVIHTSIDTTRSQTRDDFDSSTELRYPKTFPIEAKSNADMQTNCPDHILVHETLQPFTRCITSTSSDVELRFIVKYKGSLYKHEVPLQPQHESHPVFYQDMTTMKDLPWSRLPRRIELDEVYEFSNSHFAIWKADNMQTLKCFSKDHDIFLCP